MILKLLFLKNKKEKGVFLLDDDISVIVPDYLLNESEESEEFEELEESQELDETEEFEESEELEESEVQTQSIDYTSILEEMNSRLENIESVQLQQNDCFQGILTNIYFIDFVAFTFSLFAYNYCYKVF